MHASLRALLAKSIDYAGLFPPAKLRLDQAMRQYADHRARPESWMLARFVCPVAQLTELAELSEEFSRSDVPWRISVLLRGPEIADTLADLETLGAWENRTGERALVDAFELPIAITGGSERLRGALESIASRVGDKRAAKSGKPVAIFCELPASADWKDDVLRLTAAMAEFNVGHDGGTLSEAARIRFGFKLRTGGLSANAIPSADRVAHAICACRDAGVCWKATAGLHHALLHFDSTLGCWTFGFLGLFAAAALASAHSLTEDQLRPILEEDKIGNFTIEESGLGWGDLRASTEDIRTFRKNDLISFGSCSFDEPRDELKALGLL